VLMEQLATYAVSPNLGLLSYTHNQIPHQSAIFTRVQGAQDISGFFADARSLKTASLREILREMYVSHCTTIIQDGKEFDRALAYMASQYMGSITDSNGTENMGWFSNPSNGLSYQLTTSARAVCYLIAAGIDTPEKMYRFIAPYEQDLVGTHTYIWDDDSHKLHDIISGDPDIDISQELVDSLGIAPSAQPLPEVGATIHYRRVHYPHHHNSPATERRKLDRMVDLGILRSMAGGAAYGLNEA
jgi:hypothetical protein